MPTRSSGRRGSDRSQSDCSARAWSHTGTRSSMPVSCAAERSKEVSVVTSRRAGSTRAAARASAVRTFGCRRTRRMNMMGTTTQGCSTDVRGQVSHLVPRPLGNVTVEGCQPAGECPGARAAEHGAPEPLVSGAGGEDPAAQLGCDLVGRVAGQHVEEGRSSMTDDGHRSGLQVGEVRVFEGDASDGCVVSAVSERPGVQLPGLGWERRLERRERSRTLRMAELGSGGRPLCRDATRLAPGDG